MMQYDRFATIREAIQQASLFLNQHGVDSPKLQAEVILMRTAGWERAKLMMEVRSTLAETGIDADLFRRFWDGIERRAKREPLQYIVEGQEFYGRWFKVGPGVLIPRPETELLVETSLQLMKWLSPAGKESSTIRVVDIGTGSGAIAVTLALENRNAAVYAVDISDTALRIASDNARSLNAQVSFLKGDLLEPVIQQIAPVQLIVSNPPYIPSQDVEELEPEVKEYEPRLALDGGKDGLNPYRMICRGLANVFALDRPRAAAFEVGIDQADQVAELIRLTGLFDEVSIFPDLAGIPRVVAAFGSY